VSNVDSRVEEQNLDASCIDKSIEGENYTAVRERIEKICSRIFPSKNITDVRCYVLASERKLTPTKSEIESDHSPADKSYYDHLIKMYSFNEHPREHSHKEIE